MYFSFSCSYFFFCRFIYFENAVLSRKLELIYECTVGIFSILQSGLHIYHWHKRLWCAIVYCLYIKHKMNGPCTNKIGGRTTLGERHSGRTASGANKKKWANGLPFLLKDLTWCKLSAVRFLLFYNLPLF